MKRYLAFYWHNYYPGGGMNDFVGDYDTLEEAIQAVKKCHKDDLPKDLSYASGSVWDSLNRDDAYFSNFQEKK
jgi:hypothetical protein